MFKYLCMWFLASYSYDNLLKTYQTFDKETTFRDMKEFIYHQQDREDDLRKQCQLQMYVSPDNPTFVQKLIFQYNTVISQYSISSPMKIETYEEFMEASYQSNNRGKDLHFNGTVYTLLENGIKPSPVYSYANQQYERYPRNPVWSIQIRDLILQITNIQQTHPT